MILLLAESEGMHAFGQTKVKGRGGQALKSMLKLLVTMTIVSINQQQLPCAAG